MYIPVIIYFITFKYCKMYNIIFLFEIFTKNNMLLLSSKITEVIIKIIIKINNKIFGQILSRNCLYTY